jgi:hypothetical protein
VNHGQATKTIHVHLTLGNDNARWGWCACRRARQSAVGRIRWWSVGTCIVFGSRRKEIIVFVKELARLAI